ncbi:cytochrome P450 2D18 [Xylaria sp. FL0043]|nr:cytochrome P450 2D18 [Xylaria sp. FL0043]
MENPLSSDPPGFTVLSTAISLTAILLLALGTRGLPGSRSKALPPGPPTLPFLGNMHQMPPSGIHLKYTDWAKTYGAIFSLKVGQMTMVVLNTASNATRLLDQRSSLYSDRPPSHAVGDLVFHGHHPMFMNANERWKLRRKLYFQMFQESRCNKEHIRLVDAESAQLVRDMMLAPGDLMFHPGRMIYGIRTPEYSTPHYLKLRQILSDLSSLGEVGATPPVDLYPILKYLPECLWGNWKTRARLLRDKVTDLYEPLTGCVEHRRAMGKDVKSFIDGVLDQIDTIGLSREEINIAGGNLLDGGTDTMATLILTCVQAMALHPEIQKKAHEQMDRVVDESRLPTWDDYDHLPYIAQIVKEVHRWRSPGPGGFPHIVNKDDEIDGMMLPKDSVVIVNIWGIHHDGNRFTHPETFDPDRYEGQTRLAPVYANAGSHETRDHYGYGVGRRICPGIHLAERGLWMAISRIIWAFDIAPKLDDATGTPIPIDVSPESGYTDGFLNQCRSFVVDIKVRSEARRAAIWDAVSKAETEVSQVYSS